MATAIGLSSHCWEAGFTVGAIFCFKVRFKTDAQTNGQNRRLLLERRFGLLDESLMKLRPSSYTAIVLVLRLSASLRRLMVSGGAGGMS